MVIPRVFNFGSSHSLGWNNETSYSKIIAQRLGYAWDNHAMAGSSLEYILMRLAIAESEITSDDLVLIQLPGRIRYSLHVDPRKTSNINQAYKLFHYSNMAVLDREPEGDFTYGLKVYKTLVQSDEDYALHAHLDAIAILDKFNQLTARKFIFWDVPIQQPDTSIFMLQQLYTRLNQRNPQSEQFEIFAMSLNLENPWAINPDGSVDNGHFGTGVHTAWADYIQERL